MAEPRANWWTSTAPSCRTCVAAIPVAPVISISDNGHGASATSAQAPTVLKRKAETPAEELVSDEEDSDEEEEYEVEQLLQRKGKGARVKYLCSWVGYTDQTWEPRKNLPKEMVDEFDRKHDWIP